MSTMSTPHLIRPPMTAKEILAELKPLGSEGYVRILRNHGVKQPAYGVKISELKKIQKRLKKHHPLALELFDTGVYDAQYLAGMLSEDKKMSKKDLQRWLEISPEGPICGFVVATTAAESNHGWELGLEWIDSKTPGHACAGWATLLGVVSITDDAKLDLPKLKQLLKRIEKTIHSQPDRVRYVMNLFVISVGAYVKPLSADAIAVAENIGKVECDMGETDCKVPRAAEYIQKCLKRNPTFKKKKTCKC